MERNSRYRKSTACNRGKEKLNEDKRNRGKKKRVLQDIYSDSGSEEFTQDSDMDSKLGLGSLLYTNIVEEKSGSKDQDNFRRQHACKGRIKVSTKDKYDQTSYRSNLQSAIRDLKGLSFQRSHMKAIQMTPFWILFNAIYNSDDSKLKKRCDKDEKAIGQIILSYDDLKDKFLIGGSYVELTKRDVQLVLGVISGTKPLTTNSSNSEDPEWIVRCFAKEIERAKGNLVMYKSHLLNKMKDLLVIGEGRELDVARLAHCYLLAAVLAPNKNSSMPSNVTRCVEDFGGICDYDWCKYIIDMLKNQIGGRTSSRAGGCTILLPYWLCEHVKLVKPINNVAFPRFLRWNLSDVNKMLARTDIRDLEGEDVLVDELEATKVEKETTRTLLDYWKVANKRPQKESYLATPQRRRNTPGTAIKIASVHDDDFVTTVKIGVQKTPVRGVSKRMRRNILYSDDPSTSKGKESTNELDNHFKEKDALVNASTNLDYSVNGNSGFDMSMPHSSYQNDVQFDVNDQTGVEGSNQQSGQGVSKEDLVGDVQLAVGYCLSEGVERKSMALEVEFLKERIREKDMIILEHEKVIWELGKDIEALKEHVSRARENECDVFLLREELEICKADAEKMRSSLEKNLVSDKDDQLTNHEKELALKDGYIARLRAEIDELKKRPNSCEISDGNLKHKKDMQRKDEEISYLRSQLDDMHTPPTTTQVMEDPASLEIIDEIERNFTVGHDEAVQMITEKVNEMTPIVVKRDSKPEQNLNSMIKRVKDRAAKDDRKAIELTPPPSTAELIDLDGKHKSAVVGKMRWDKRMDAVKKTKPEIKKLIEKFWGIRGGSSVNRMVLCDTLMVLHHERLSSSVIDCWAELLLRLAKGRENAARIVVFNGNCWELIANVKQTSKGLVDLFINGPLDKVGADSILLFPMVATSMPGAPGRLGDHWTLLKLDLKEGGWTFLNPRCPRTSDPHLTASFIVIDYVESRLRERFRSLEPRHLVVKGRLGRPIPMPSVQQSMGTLDCGVVVCYHIENEIFKRRSSARVMSTGISGTYRKRIVEWLLQPDDIVVADGDLEGSENSSREISN